MHVVVIYDRRKDTDVHVGGKVHCVKRNRCKKKEKETSQIMVGLGKTCKRTVNTHTI